MSTHTSSFSSLRMMAVSVLAGLGVGYVIGILTAKWAWRRTNSTPPRQRDQPELAAAIIGLTTEIYLLRNSVSANLLNVGRQSRHAPTETTDFVSALGETPANDVEEDEFFDINDGDGAVVVTSTFSPQYDFNYLDQVGKGTLESGASCLSVLETVEELLKEAPEATGLLWRQARALVHLSMHHERKNEKEKELELLIQAAEVGRMALDLDENVWQSHQWYAVAVGSQAKHQGTQKKIIAGHEYKTHIDLAVNLNKNEPTLYYLRGRWYYDVAGISWLEKKAAATLYVSPPQATYTDALEDFMRAEQLTPGVWLGNMLMVAKCHIKLGNVPTAVEWLQKCSGLPVITIDDKTAQQEVEGLLSLHLEQ